MASRGLRGFDDSFGSSNRSGDSLSEEDVAEGLVPVDPFARRMEGDDGYDDSFYDDEVQEETLFGVPAGQLHNGGHYGGENLVMLGKDRLQDTIGIGAQIAKTGRVEESPTPVTSARPLS